MNKLYKVLKNGKSFHGGSLEWSLPKDGEPGDWHEVPNVDMCRSGLHVTNYPDAWLEDGVQVYEVEVAGTIVQANDGMKVAAQRARLLKQVSVQEYAADRGVTMSRYEPCSTTG